MGLGDIFSYAAQAGAAGMALWYASTMLFTVGQKQEALLTSFGKHVRTEDKPGLHLKKPWPFNVIAAKIGTDLIQVNETLDTKTKDDLFVKMPISIQFEIDDSAKFNFENRDPVGNMKKAVSAAVRTATAGKQFQELYTERDEISTHVIEQIENTVREYGINLRRIIIDEPTAPEAVQKAFNEVRASERMMEASKNKAAAHKIEKVAMAEADKEADILRGQGKAGFRKALFEQYADQIKSLTDSDVPREEALKIMMDTMHQDTLRDIGAEGNLVITPQSTSGVTAPSLAEIDFYRRTTAKEQNNLPGAPIGTSPSVPAPV